ncbi:MAG TPA: sigma-70 family RNA polymerase sigma factor [Rugosimonospora sp.]|nr:sigma-70 family RNA polymerase sigma factor [Rugosimonospora sp.]
MTAATIAPRDAFTADLFVGHRLGLQRYIRRIVNDPHRVEDLVQETLLRAWLHADQLLASGSVEAWLYRVARNIAIDELRYRQARPADPAPEPGSWLTTADPAERVVTRIDLVRALAKLPQGHRRVLVEIFFFSRTVNEVALRLQIPRGTVKSRLFYGLRHLRTTLSRDPGAASPVDEPRRPGPHLAAGYVPTPRRLYSHGPVPAHMRPAA